MLRFQHNGDAERIEMGIKRFRNLLGHPFLHLQAPGKNFHDAGQLAQSDNFSVGNIRDMRFAEKRDKMMFAERKEIDILERSPFRCTAR